MTTWANALFACACGHYYARPFESHATCTCTSGLLTCLLPRATKGRMALQGIARRLA